MRRSPIRRKTPLERGKPIPRGKRMRRESPQHARDRVIYNKMAKQHLIEHPFCQCCGPLFGRRPRKANQVHHAKGRGIYYLDKSTFRSSCGGDEGCNWYIHHVNPNHAREVGLLPPR